MSQDGLELENLPLAGICAAYLADIEEELQNSFVKVSVRLIGKNEIAPKALTRLSEKIGNCLGGPKAKSIVEVIKSPDNKTESVTVSVIMIMKNTERRSSSSLGASFRGSEDMASKVRETLKTTVQRQNAAKKLGEDAELVPFAGFSVCEIGPEEDLTTKEVCEVYVKPKTAKEKNSFVEMLADRNDELVSGAGTIIIHAWQSPFKAIWQSLEPELIARGDDPSLVYVWLDVLSLPQHIPLNISPHFLTTTLCDAIGQIGSSVLVLSDWTNPVPFRRLWCIWEILATIQQGTELSVIMPPQQRKAFDDRVFHDLPAVIKASFDAIDSEHASASIKNDEVQILNSIRDSIGFDGANLVTKDRLLEWLSLVSESATRDPDRTRDHLATATFCYRLAKIMSSGQGKHVEAEAMLRKAVDIRTVELGPTHDLTTECAIALANVFRLQGKAGEAEVTLRKVCENMTITKGPKHPETLLALATLTRVLVDRGNFEEAERICTDTLTATEEQFGLKNQRTLELLVTLSQLADLRCDSDAAALRLRRALEGYEMLLGPDHPQTLNVKADLAGFLAELENFDEAEALFKEATEKLTTALGGAHEWTIKASTGLSVLQKVREGLGPNYTPGRFASKAAVPSTTPEENNVPEAPTSRTHAASVTTAKKITFATGEGVDEAAVRAAESEINSLRDKRHGEIKNSEPKEKSAKKHLRGYLEKLPIELSQREKERLIRKGEGIGENSSGVLKPAKPEPPKQKSLLLKMASGIGNSLVGFKSADKPINQPGRKSTYNMAADSSKLAEVNKNWERRFFQAQSNKHKSSLVYWLSEEDMKNGRDKRGDFPLDDANTRIFETTPFGPTAFAVTGPKGRLHLRAESLEAKAQWIEVFEAALAFRGANGKAKLLDKDGEIPPSIQENKAFFTGSFVNMDSLLGQHSTILKPELSPEEELKLSMMDMGN